MLGLVACLARAITGLGSGAADQAFSDFVGPLLYLPPACFCFVRARHTRTERLPWSAFGIGFLLWAAGWLVYGVYVRRASAPPYPSPADALWLAFYPVAYVGLVMLVKARTAGLRPSFWLDGLIGSLSFGALAATFLVQPILDASGDSPVAVATSLAYPAGDLLLLNVTLAMLALTRWHPPRDWRLIAGAILVQVATDWVYVYEAAHGTWTSGTLLDAGWLATALLIGYAATQRQGRIRRVKADRWLVVVLPSVFTAAALGVLVYGNFEHNLTTVATLLASGALGLALVRAGVTFREQRGLRLAAERDALTGLLNHGAFHRALEEELVRARHEDAPFAVLLLDLDGFKQVNDLHGHAAGDEVLRRVAQAIRRECRSTDIGGRLGGDEFALLLPHLDGAGASAVAVRIRQALEGRASGAGISFGVAAWPVDGPEKDALLLRADLALYAAKAHRDGTPDERPAPAKAVDPAL